MPSRILLLSVVLAASAALVACGSDDDDGAASGADAIVASPSTENEAIAAVVRDRLTQDFGDAPSLRGKAIDLKVGKITVRGSRAFMSGRVLKRDSSGKATEITSEDFPGSEYESRLGFHYSTTAQVYAALEKRDGTWELMTDLRGDLHLTAIEVGPGDERACIAWDYDFGIDRAWLDAECRPLPASKPTR